MVAASNSFERGMLPIGSVGMGIMSLLFAGPNVGTHVQAGGTLLLGERHRNTIKILLPLGILAMGNAARNLRLLLNQTSKGEIAVNKEKAWDLARHWVAAWNAHDLELIMTHYEEAVELTSPVAARLLEKADGKVLGKTNLRAYFQRGLQAYPDLRFQLEDVLWGLHSVVLYYTNQKGTSVAEFMELSATEKFIRVIANYNA
jgi:predicted ester cyclase